MKIFSPPESAAAPGKPVKSSETEGPKKSGKVKKGRGIPDPADKKEISEAAIREKLASHVETSNTAKSQVLQKNSQALGAGFMNPDAAPIAKAVPEIKAEAKPGVEGNDEEKEESKSLKESHLLLSDVKLNDPNDTNTQEKLRSVLKMGAFNFNPKEKDALERILGTA